MNSDLDDHQIIAEIKLEIQTLTDEMNAILLSGSGPKAVD